MVAAIVALTGIRPIQQLEEILALRIIGSPRGAPDHQLAFGCRLHVVSKITGEEIGTNADLVEAALPDFRINLGRRIRLPGYLQQQWLAVGHAAVAVCAAPVPEAIQQLVGEPDIVFIDAGAIVFIMSDHADRDDHLRLHRLAVARLRDIVLQTVCHRNRPAQRDLLLAIAADDRVFHVERGIDNLGHDHAVERDLLRRILRFQLVPIQHGRRRHLRQLVEVQLLVRESQPARLFFFDDADFNAPNLRHFLALHVAHHLIVPRIA